MKQLLRIPEKPHSLKDSLTYLQVPAIIEPLDIDFIESLAENIYPYSRVLDVGCGEGGIISKLKDKRPDLEIHGVDKSLLMLLCAKNKNRQNKLTLGDAHKLPYKDNYFNYIISNSVLHHLTDPQQGLKEMMRVCQKPGMIIIRDLIRPNSVKELEYNLGCRKRPKDVNNLFKKSLFSAYSIPEFKKMLSGLKISSFKIIQREFRFICNIYL